MQFSQNPPMSNVQWSKSIVLENKVAINFDFRSGAKKSGHLDYPLQSYGPKFVQKTQNLHFLKKPQGFDLFESCSSNYYISDDFSLKQNVWDILF